jgi:hypothetical protein
MSRALQGIQSITDGCQYRPQEVFSFKSPPELKSKLVLPGLETLSDLRKLKQHRFIKTESLGGEDWHVYISGLNDSKDFSTRIDILAYEHIKNFWDHYGIQIQYQVEHKPENVAKTLFWMKRAHYGIRIVYDKLEIENSKKSSSPAPDAGKCAGGSKGIVIDIDPNPYRTKQMKEKKACSNFEA